MLQNNVATTASLFDTPEKWNVYLEIQPMKAEIVKLWFTKLGYELVNRFHKSAVDKWNFDKGGMTWYLSKFGSRSLALWLEEQYNDFSLWADNEFFDQEKISILLKTEKYAPIRAAFSRLDELNNGPYQIIERGNYYFDSDHDGHFNEDSLAWYAGNDTQRLVNQIVEKVDRFRKDKQLTDLLAEICRESKR